MIRLVVDADRCIGSGVCEMLEEAIFVIDEATNVAQIKGDGLVTAEQAAVLIDRCPSGAIGPSQTDSAA